MLPRYGVTTVSDLGVSSLPSPVGGQEEEVERFGHTILTWLHCIHIPGGGMRVSNRKYYKNSRWQPQASYQK